MARVTHVKSARQRYATVPVLNDDGSPKMTPVTVIRKVRDPQTNLLTESVEPKKTKTGREVFMKVTRQDKSKPLPNLRCDFPGCDIDGGEIKPGTAYKHITPRSGPYGGTQKNRHEAHPSWNVWEYSYSRSAQVARAQNDMNNEIDSFEFSDTEDFDGLRDSLVEMASEQRDEQEDALQNMPEQLQDGSQAQEYYEALEAWVSDLENVFAPDADNTCQECDGTGTISGEPLWYVNNADGTGHVFEEGFGSEEDAWASLHVYLERSPHDEKAEDFVVECEEEDEECSACEGDGEQDGLTEDWIEEAKQALRDAVDEVQI